MITNWAEQPIRRIPVGLLVWPCHDLDPGHFHHAHPSLTKGPIHVERLVTGHYFIHDGRHRAIRAQMAGETMIDARVVKEVTA